MQTFADPFRDSKVIDRLESPIASGAGDEPDVLSAIKTDPGRVSLDTLNEPIRLGRLFKLP
ncbi:MAG: hypothetical protein HN656_10325 [Acidiferrobacteraceae bacterium]|nr:hypothetical protein [Acidiferrobacteraceae bacterium]MBT4806532.1 hypothetical protein [Acidiferrobacteraceae bacterium]MBT7518322.1 hypothetical protein [Acidiferrobacteraceae bacterium]